MTCPAPVLKNGEVTYDRPAENGRYLVETKASFTCNFGYTLKGTSVSCNFTLRTWEQPVAQCGKNIEGTKYYSFLVSIEPDSLICNS